MGMTTSASLAAACLILAAFCGWRGAKPFDPIKGPRMIPWRPLMAAFATLGLLTLIHVGNLATGRR